MSTDRIRSSTSTIRTGQPSSSTEELLIFGTLPSRGSSGETRRSRSPRNRSTTTPKRWLRSLATTTGNGSPLACASSSASSSTRVRLDQADELVVEQDVRLALELADLLAVDHQDAVDPAQGEGVGLAGDLDQQGTDDRDGDRQLEDEPRPLAGPAGDPDRAPHRMHHVLHDVEPDAAAGDLGDLLLGREAGQEEEVEQLGLAEPTGHRGGGQPALDDLGAEPLEVDAAAVVGEDDLEHPRAVAGLQADGRHRRLAGGAALVGRLDAVVQGIADQVVERRLEPVEDVAIDAGGLAVDLESRLLAQLPGHVADQPREAADAVGQRTHPAGQHLVVQPAGEVLAHAGECLDALDRLGQALQVVGGPRPGLGQPLVPGRRQPRPRIGAGGASADRVGPPGFAGPPAGPICRPRSRQSAVDQRPEPVALHQGLARQAHQPAQALGRDPHDAVAVGRFAGGSEAGGSRLAGGWGLTGRVPHASRRGPLPPATRALGGVILSVRFAGAPGDRDGSQGRKRSIPVGRRSTPVRLGRPDPAFLDRRQVGHEGVDLVGVLGLPGFQLRTRRAAQTWTRRSNTAEQDVDMFRLEDQLPFLGGDEAVFHRVGDPDRRRRARRSAPPP